MTRLQLNRRNPRSGIVHEPSPRVFLCARGALAPQSYEETDGPVTCQVCIAKRRAIEKRRAADHARR